LNGVCIFNGSLLDLYTHPSWLHSDDGAYTGLFFMSLIVFAMALRKWRSWKPCCQVVLHLAKDLSIKVEVKSLIQHVRSGYEVAIDE
jgi:hypothetical protein